MALGSEESTIIAQSVSSLTGLHSTKDEKIFFECSKATKYKPVKMLTAMQ